MPIPNPNTLYPIAKIKRTAFLKNVVNAPNVDIGDYTYYDDPDGPECFIDNVLYHFPFVGDRLVIGKFCQIAARTKFIMNGANHSTAGVSTFPFAAFGGDWAGRYEGELVGENKGDTIVGNDVWIGYGATILPGIRIGDGAIIGSCSVVTRDVAPYEIVAGNPAKIVRSRFGAATIKSLLEIAWWNWPVEQITEAIAEISCGDLASLKARDVVVRQNQAEVEQ